MDAVEALALFHSPDVFAAMKISGSVEPPFLTALVDLHNAGALNLFEVVDRPELQALPGFRFFTVQRFLAAAIPRLEADETAMMSFVRALIDRGGADGAAGRPNTAFIDWCRAIPTRASAIVAAARAGDALAIGFLASALIALDDTVGARAAVADFDDQRRDAALSALGSLAHDAAERARTLTAVAAVVAGSASDPCLAICLRTLIRLHAQASAGLARSTLALMQAILKAGGDATLHEAAQTLWEKPPLMTAPAASLLLRALRRTNPDHAGTISFLDTGLYSLMENGFRKEAIRFVAVWLRGAGGAVSLEALDGFMAELAKIPSELEETAVRWWLTGDAALCLGLEHHFGGLETPHIFQIDLGALGLTDAQIEFVCRKALGFGFFQPVTAASVTVCALRGISGALSRRLEALLFDPLLVSYGGALADWLAALPASDPAHASVRRVLNRKRAYLRGLTEVGVIKELHPPASRRDAERSHRLAEIRAATKEARKRSPLLSMIQTSVLLYGRQSMTFVEDPSTGEDRAVEMVLQGHGFSTEMARYDVLDPISLETMIYGLRTERIRS